MLSRLASLLFPPRCCFCGGIVRDASRPCPSCEKRLSLILGRKCPLCGAGEELCRCRKQPRDFDRCVSCAYYSGPMKRAIHHFKFRGAPGAAVPLAGLMETALKSELAGIPFDRITFVPMAPARQRMRGYNQAELLARELSRRTGIPLEGLLEKTKDTPMQHTLNAQERRENLRGSFAVTGPVRGRTILLVDDVVTTGETLQECARCLRDEGAKAIYCVTAARSA